MEMLAEIACPRNCLRSPAVVQGVGGPGRGAGDGGPGSPAGGECGQGPNWTAADTPEVRALQAAHLAHLRRLGEEGQVRVGGPFLDALQLGTGCHRPPDV